jgi:hypothetical protein
VDYCDCKVDLRLAVSLTISLPPESEIERARDTILGPSASTPCTVINGIVPRSWRYVFSAAASSRAGSARACMHCVAT